MFFASFPCALEAKDVGLMIALRADERRHVLDHAEDLVAVRKLGFLKPRKLTWKNSYVDVHLLKHGDPLEGVLQSNVLGSRNDDNT